MQPILIQQTVQAIFQEPPPADEIAYANSKDIKTLALVTNNFNGNTAKTLLESQDNRQRLISNILSVLKKEISAYYGQERGSYKAASFFRFF